MKPLIEQMTTAGLSPRTVKYQDGRACEGDSGPSGSSRLRLPFVVYPKPCGPSAFHSLFWCWCSPPVIVTESAKTSRQRSARRKEGETTFKQSVPRDSEVWFNEHWNQNDLHTLSLSYTQHYNESLSKCFVMVKRRYSTNKLISFSNWGLWEIYENVQHANSTRMVEEHPQPAAHHEESQVACEVYGKRCKTSEEFDSLVHAYMND